jgi:4-hydroxy-tetrahydrodipicolinate synthase
MGKELRGIIPAVVTPFTPDGRVDEGAFRKVLHTMIDQGVHGLFPVGTGGEFFALTREEKERLMAVAVEEAAARVFVMPNAGAITTAESVALARHAEAVGSDAVSVVTPFFLKPSQEELFEHYRAICAAVKIPVLAYNIPERTGGVMLSAATVSRLAREIPNFSGIKDSTGDLANAAELVRSCPPGFRVFMGRDTLIYGALLHGCVGAVAATANVAPGLAVGSTGRLERATCQRRWSSKRSWRRSASCSPWDRTLRGSRRPWSSSESSSAGAAAGPRWTWRRRRRTK